MIKTAIRSVSNQVGKYKLTKWMSPLMEEVDAFFFSSGEKSQGRCKIKDFLDYKRMMIFVVFALTPTLVLGIYNCGRLNNLYLSSSLIHSSSARVYIMNLLGLGLDPSSIISNFVLGCLYFLPMYIVTLVVGGLIEVAFSVIRKKSINEGFLVTSLIFPMILPCGIELWKVALGISFGIIFGKEVFGGTAKNIFNPALVGRIFLFFTYPSSMSGSIWLDGLTGATILSGSVDISNISWMSLFLGSKLGCIGETSVVACLIGGLCLNFTKISSAKITFSSIISLYLTALLFEYLGFSVIPASYHLVLGGAMFGIFFMATDPVTGCYSSVGKYIYGSLIGFLIVVIRSLNPGFPEGVMFAILIANALAPLIDYLVLSSHIKSKQRLLLKKQTNLDNSLSY